ncbi:MAG: IclR family transcriptional regulator, partial [Deltaproteobacteria bacterium]|nr:IclR family transcriptional regulator [Deltaproteobacteria bacterium]
FNVGERVPFHVASGAKAILAFSPSELVDRVIQGKLRRYTSNTITDPEVFKKQLEDIRRRGVAYDRGEYNIDVISIGAPVFNHVREPVAAISVCAPAYRMEKHFESDIVLHLKEAAAEISAGLFYQEESD